MCLLYSDQLIYSVISSGLELDVTPTISLRPSSSADGLRGAWRRRTFVHPLKKCGGMGGNLGSYQADHVAEPTAPTALQCLARVTQPPCAALHMHGFVSNKPHMKREIGCVQQHNLRLPEKTFVNVIISMFYLSRKFPFSLALRFTQGRMPSFIFFGGNQVS